MGFGQMRIEPAGISLGMAMRAPNVYPNLKDDDRGPRF